MKYKATKVSYGFQGRYWDKGDLAEVSKSEEEAAKKNKKHELNSHFEKMGGDEPEQEPEKKGGKKK